MKYFGTDGIRKKAEEFTSDFLYKFVYGLKTYSEQKGLANIKIMVGGDTRESSERMIKEICSALSSLKIEHCTVGVLPTPAIGYCFYEMGYDFAIDITASHNPYTDNGLKVFERGKSAGEKLSVAGCETIEKFIDSEINHGKNQEDNRDNKHDEAIEVYKRHLLNYVGDADLSGMRVGMDCANGATSVINKTILEKLGANVTVYNSNEEYGRGINNNCGSTHIEGLIEHVKKEHFDMGVAFDGDGDRSLFVDENGNLIDGDQVIVVVAEALGLKHVAATVMVNQGLLNWAKANGIEVEITPVGDHNLVEAMGKKEIQIGAEQNGHIILPHKNCGDGLLVSAFVAKIICGKKFSDVASSMTKTPQVEQKVEANSAKKAKFKESDQVKEILQKYEEILDEKGGRLLVRPSGTEDILRICVWANDEKMATNFANEIKKDLEEIL